MYELIILALLMRRPVHGYRIAKAINDIIGPVAKASNGRIYPLLSTLVESGLVTARDGEENGRQIRTYEILEPGRRRFHELMMETGSAPREYQEIFSFKVTMLGFLGPEERRRLVEHYIQFCRAHMMHMEVALRMARDGAELGDPPAEDLARLRLVAEHRLKQWQAELSWAEQLSVALTTTQP